MTIIHTNIICITVEINKRAYNEVLDDLVKEVNIIPDILISVSFFRTKFRGWCLIL